jgi:hypothetical protein
MVFIFYSNILMHSTLVSFIVFSLVVCLFLMFDVSNSCTHCCLVQLTQMDL